ncbi:MAG: hypothetical protein H8E15_11535 [Planctomycetes bacterium]|nr:hypothetical protein [Planctomycetota bacterium]
MRLLRYFCASMLLALATAPPSACQEGGRIPVRVVGERLLISCDISSHKMRVPVNLFFELDALCGLQLHNKAAASLEAESGDGQPRPLTLHFPEFQIEVPRREHGDEDLLDEFTKYFSADMGEDAVVGTIGAQILKDYHLTYDLARGYLALEPKHELAQEKPTPIPGTVLLSLTEENELLWMPARLKDGTQYAIAIGASRYDTIVDQDFAYALGAPAGNIGELNLGEIALDDYLALRPEELVLTHPDRAIGVLGINFFRHFRVEIDRVNRWARLTPTEPPEFPQDDLAFFHARADEDPEMLQAFLEQWPQARLGKEAAQLLLFWRIDDAGNEEQIRKALAFVDHFEQDDLRATGALDLMKILAGDGWKDYQIWAGELGLISGRNDRYPDAVHKIHSKLGEIHLAKNHSEQAWRHLLSAAFGMPDDGMINLNLGNYYEQQGRYRRAFSRFVQASIVPESGPQAVEGLMRVQPKLGSEEAFSVDLVERMIEGKVLNFGAAAAYEANEDHAKGKVSLIEFFTNGQLEGAEAGALANEGLLSHFKDGPAAFLSYHLEKPGLDPLVQPYGLAIAAERHVSNPYVHVIDGVAHGPGGGRTRDREAIYSRLRDMTYQALKLETTWRLKVEDLRVEDGWVRGKVTVAQQSEGASSAEIGASDETFSDHRLCVVLAERGVLFPGSSKVVIHRMLARAALTPGHAGLEIELQDGQMVFEFEESLAKIQKQNETWLQQAMDAGKGQTVLMSTALDPEQLSVVAYIRSTSTGRIEQATQVHHQVDQEAKL